MGLAHKDVPIKNSDRMNHQARGHLAVGIVGFTSDNHFGGVHCWSPLCDPEMHSTHHPSTYTTHLNYFSTYTSQNMIQHASMYISMCMYTFIYIYIMYIHRFAIDYRQTLIYIIMLFQAQSIPIPSAWPFSRPKRCLEEGLPCFTGNNLQNLETKEAWSST